MDRHPVRVGLPCILVGLIPLLIAQATGVRLMGQAPRASRPEAASSRTWTINYAVSGGIAGISQRLSLRDYGEATVESRREGQTTFKISPEQLARIRGLVQRLNLSAPPPAKPAENIPDMLYHSLTVTSGGHEVPIGAEGSELAKELQSILAEALKRAEDEKWNKAGVFRLGRVWKVQEEVRDNQGMWHGEQWDGTWTRRADTHIFDAVWRNNKSNEEVRDTVVLDSAERGSVILHRASGKVKYQGSYAANQPESVSGYLNPSHACWWRATIQY